MLQLQYYIHTGHILHLKNPKRFTEKIQWYKLYYRDPLMSQCVNKFNVRDYVKNCGLSHILNELYGCFDSANEINFDKLPQSFVIKDTLGGGGGSVIIVKDKTKIDKTQLYNTLNRWTAKAKNVTKHVAREWVYENQRNQIIVEKMINADVDDRGVVDYKLHCFEGRVKIIDVAAYRNFGGITPFATLDADYNRLSVHYLNETDLECIPSKPSNLDEMKRVAEQLAKGFPYVRVDLYNENNIITFGELTFFQASGYNKFDPDDFDYQLGQMFILPQTEMTI